MNWYKNIKSADQMIPVGDICQHVSKSIKLQNNGDWTTETEDLVPGYKNQKRYRCKLTGKNVVMPGDWFHVKVYSLMRKAPNVIHPYQGSYESRGWDNPQMGEPSPFTEEEVNKRFKAFNELEPVETKEYDSETGSELIDFIVVIFGAKQEQEDKGYFNIEEIGESQKGELKTPYEIGQFVKTTINNFYFGGDDNDEPEDNPMPPTPGVGVEDREHSYA